MRKEYEEISDDEIINQFSRAKVVKFSARRNNAIRYRSITFGNIGWWLPLSRVLPLIGISPQDLRPVFNRQTVFERVVTPKQKSRQNRILKRLGLKAASPMQNMVARELELPDVIESYDLLGAFQIYEEKFRILSRIIGKSIEVLREDGGSGEHNYLFTVNP